MPKFADRFFTYATAFRILILTAACSTSLLVLLSPGSLTAVASESAGTTAEILAYAMIVLAVLGWADVIVHDVLGRMLIPRIEDRVRSHLCVLTYASLSSLYGIFAFIGLDPDVETSWILIIYYLCAFISGMVSVVAMVRHVREGLQP